MLVTALLELPRNRTERCQWDLYVMNSTFPYSET